MKFEEERWERHVAYSHECSHGSSSGLRLIVEIRHDPRDKRDRRTGKSAQEEAKDQEGGPARGEGAGEGPEAEHDECCYREQSPTELLTQRRPYDRT